MKKLKTQFKVVGLEDVFKTAVEVNGTLIREHCTNPRRWQLQVQPDGKSLEKAETCKQQKRE